MKKNKSRAPDVLPHKIRMLMAERGGVKAAAVAKATGVSASLFSDWMQMKSRPSMDDAFRLAGFFGVTLDWLANDKIVYSSVPNERAKADPVRTSERPDMPLAVEPDDDALAVPEPEGLGTGRKGRTNRRPGL